MGYSVYSLRFPNELFSHSQRAGVDDYNFAWWNGSMPGIKSGWNQKISTTIRLESNDTNQMGLGLYNIWKLGLSFLLSPFIYRHGVSFLCLSMIKCMPFNSPIMHFLHVMHFFHNLLIFLMNNSIFSFIQLYIQ